MNLATFVERHKAAICSAVVNAFPPLYHAAARSDPDYGLRDLLRRPLGGQAEAVRATALSLRTNRGTVVVGEQGCGKCVHPDTLVSIDGAVQTIESIWSDLAGPTRQAGDGETALPTREVAVPTLDEGSGSVGLARVEALYRQRVAEQIRRIELVDGRTIRVTRAHKFLTPHGWTNQIETGGYVAVPRREPVLGHRCPVDPRFMAWLIAEGCEVLNGRAAVLLLSQKDPLVLESLVPTARELGMTGISIRSPRSGQRAATLRATATPVVRQLQSLGYSWGRRSAQKRIPAFLMRADGASIRQFLSAYIAADGHVAVDGQEVEITTASEGLAHDLCTLLRRVGVYSTIYSKRAAATNGRGISRTYFRVFVSGAALRTLASEVGCEDRHKADRMMRSFERQPNANRDTVYVGDIIPEAKQLTGLSLHRSGGLFASDFVSGRVSTMNRARAERLTELLTGWEDRGVRSLGQRLRQRLDQDVFFVKVRSVAEEWYEGYVYDLQVAETHNFVANHLIVHNTYVGAAAAYVAGMERVLVMAPPHLVRKWAREIKRTVPCARTAIARSLTDLDRITAASPRRVGPPGASRVRARRSPSALFVIVSRERAKLGYRWIGCAVERHARDEYGQLVRDETGAPVRALCCPACFAPQADDEGVPLTREDLAEKRRKCIACGAPLWCADRTGPRRYPLADYLRERLPGYFQLFIADEVHELKARGSAQGLAGATLADACEKTLALSGTIFGGYSSTLFHLLRRFSPQVRAEFGYRDEPRWVSRYGIVHRITKKNPDAYTQDGRQSKRRSYVTRIVEKPGIAPAVLFHLLPNCVFLRLSDVAKDLPPYAERVVLYPLDSTEFEGVSQATAYRHLAGALIAAVRDALAKGSKRLLAAYLQTLLAYPDGCTKAEIVLDKKTGNAIAAAPALPEDFVYPKERVLLDLVRDQRARGRRVVVYLANTETRDLTPRLRSLLEGAGVRVAVLKAGTVAPERREEWLAKRVEEGAEVLLCHPKLVQTGLDLLDWHAYVFYQLEYSTYVMRQASRRGWRIGQKQPIEVYHFAYEGTIQAEGLALTAAKLRAAVLLDGELPQDGLAALDDDGEDLFLALARRLTEDSTADAQSLEALFAQAQQSAAEEGDLLVDDAWFADDNVDAHTQPLTPFPTLPAQPDQHESVPVQPVALVAAGRDGRLRLPLELAAPPPRANEPADDSQRAARAGRVLTFGELERLVKRRRAGRRPVPDGQLTLFAA